MNVKVHVLFKDDDTNDEAFANDCNCDGISFNYIRAYVLTENYSFYLKS